MGIESESSKNQCYQCKYKFGKNIIRGYLQIVGQKRAARIHMIEIRDNRVLNKICVGREPKSK